MLRENEDCEILQQRWMMSKIKKKTMELIKNYYHRNEEIRRGVVMRVIGVKMLKTQ